MKGGASGVRRIERIANDANAGLDAVAIIVAPG